VAKPDKIMLETDAIRVTSLSRKPGNDRELDNCQGNVRVSNVKVREISEKSWGKILSGKLFVANFKFGAIPVFSGLAGHLVSSVLGNLLLIKSL